MATGGPGKAYAVAKGAALKAFSELDDKQLVEYGDAIATIVKYNDVDQRLHYFDAKGKMEIICEVSGERAKNKLPKEK